MVDSATALLGLNGRCALVTGGSVGIGRAIALGLARYGADVAVQFAPVADAAVGRLGAGEEIVAAIGALGRQAHGVAADFSRPGEARRVVVAAEAALGRLDILVVAASTQRRQAFADVTTADVAGQVAVNLSSTIELLQVALPGMSTRGWGRVLSIGSLNQTRPDPELAVYAALKAAQHNLIANLARVHADRGVTLNTLSPGLVATDRNAERRADPTAWREIQRGANPMGRAGLPEEMVGAAVMLCGDAAAFITGADLQATGGGHL